jgi:putative addiction module killer protein
VIRLEEYINKNGHNRFGAWFSRLNGPSAARVVTALERLAHGHQGALKPVGEGVSEYRIDFGPGYRIYLGQDGEHLIILVGGSTKQGQDSAIKVAKVQWAEYRERKREAAQALKRKPTKK